ncbi:MAG: hypothetical protein AAGI92_05530 [Pseudomonadota bacterium]
MINRRAFTSGMAVAASAAVAPRAFAQNYRTPERGTAERRAILDAVRPRIEAEMRGEVEFVVQSLRVLDGWAFAVLDPQRPGGRPIDIADTGYADDLYIMDGLTVFALMRERDGRWHLIDSVTGPTDVAFQPWPEFYGAPRIIFGF